MKPLEALINTMVVFGLRVFGAQGLDQENRCWLVMDLARGGDLHNKIFDELNISIKKGHRIALN